jgi:hypothetical protein
MTYPRVSFMRLVKPQLIEMTYVDSLGSHFEELF